jgi:ribosomal protein L23
LFSIQFDIGRNKITLKVKEKDNEESLARNIQAIYSLKEENYL